jgi:beta-galactosidase
VALNVGPTVTPQDIRIWTWSALARGVKGIHYYAWYPMSSGYESGGFGMIQLDGGITERARMAGIERDSLLGIYRALFGPAWSGPSR